VNDASRRRGKIYGLEVARAKRFGDHFELLSGGLIAIYNDEVLVAQPACTPARAISDFTHNLFATDLEPDPLRSLGELFHDSHHPRFAKFAHFTCIPAQSVSVAIAAPLEA
jgi:hypothetical protein